MSERLSIWEWACSYTGDPESWATRGRMIAQFLTEEGLRPEHTLLEPGCGNLSQGKELIEYLHPGGYVGVEPNGWLVEAALERFPHLLDRRPVFLWRDDFDASALKIRFDFAVAHSVLSHVAHWQMELLLSRVRRVMRDGGVLLASLRLGDDNTFAAEWRYPDVSFFRLDTLRVLGFHAGWHIEHLPAYRERLISVAPNDLHDWVRFTAVPSADDQNRLRLAEEARQYDERELAEIAHGILRDRERQRAAELAAAREEAGE